MKQPDYAELGNSPAAQRLFSESQDMPYLRKRIFNSLQKWTKMLHDVKGTKHCTTLYGLIRKAFAEAVENDMQIPKEMKIGIRSVFCTRYRKMLKM